MRIVVLASGRGSNFCSIADAVKNGQIPNTEIVGLISNKAQAPALEEARKRSIPSTLVEHKTFRKEGRFDRESYEVELCRQVSALRPDWICLAGYMLILGPTLLKEFPGRIINIHPSILPLFKGLHPQRQALEAGVCLTGCTVHFVNEALDGGPIIEQETLRIQPGDTEESLAQRLLPVEHMTYVKALRRLCTEKFEIRGNRVCWQVVD